MRLKVLILTILFIVDVKAQDFTFPIIENFTNQEANFRRTNSVEKIWRNIQYIGEYVDSFKLKRIIDSSKPIGNNYVRISDDVSKLYPTAEEVKLSIHIDTGQVLIIEHYGRGLEYYRGYPLIIENKTDSTTIVGAGYHIDLFLEALDENGFWRRIEREPVFECAVGLKYVLLPAKAIAIVLSPIYKGDFETKLRYRLGRNYSPVFIGQIAKQQLE